jgi:hypothetical protein
MALMALTCGLFPPVAGITPQHGAAMAGATVGAIIASSFSMAMERP